MKLNQILLDILDWIKRILWYKNKQIKKKPYEILETTQCKYGVLKRVERDTPRAVLTYIYTPFPVMKDGNNKAQKPFYDYHICLDHLWALDNSELSVKAFQLAHNKDSFKLPVSKKRTMGTATHSVTVLKSTRVLDKNGNYLTEPVFYQTYDFVGRDFNTYRDKYALTILKDVTSYLKTKKFISINWNEEIIISQKYYMGTSYMKQVASNLILGSLDF